MGFDGIAFFLGVVLVVYRIVFITGRLDVSWVTIGDLVGLAFFLCTREVGSVVRQQIVLFVKCLVLDKRV